MPRAENGVPRPAPQRSVQVSVVLPCNNEESHVAAEVDRICRALEGSGHTYELIVIDDGSVDRTWAEVRAQAARRATVRPVRFEVNGGPGTARRLGTMRARGSVVVWTDADMTYPNERIPDLVRVLEDDPFCDQVVGARTSEQGSLKIARACTKWVIRKLAERLTGTTIPDLNSGLRAFRRHVALPYLHLLPPGFSCVTTITLAFLADQHPVRYIPVSYAPRSGRSKFRVIRDSYRFLLQVLAVTTYFNPLRVLTPIALLLMCVGTVLGIRGIVVDGNIAVEAVVTFMSGLIVFSLALVGNLVVKSRHRAGAALSHFPLASRTRLGSGPTSGPGIHGGDPSASPQPLAEPQPPLYADEGDVGLRVDWGAGADGRALPAVRRPPPG